MRSTTLIALLALGCANEGDLRPSVHAPEVSIVDPAAGEIVGDAPGLQLVSVIDSGSALYGVDELDLRWRSDVDGVLDGTWRIRGNEAVFTSDTPLSLGAHRLTVSAIAPDDNAASDDRVRVHVHPDAPPTASLLGPVNGDRLADDQLGLAEAIVADTETATGALTVTWLVDGHRRAVTTPEPGGRTTLPLDLQPGWHLLAVEVRDDAGLSARDAAFVEVLAADVDGDGHRSPEVGGDDCDDGNADVHPDAIEACNGIDDDCDRLIDDADPDRVSDTMWAHDGDGDGWGGGDATATCVRPGPAWVARAGDCDDRDPAVNPGAVEVCDDAAAIDEDCDGWIDDADPDAVGDLRQWRDGDADGFGAGEAIAYCHPRAGWVVVDGDCDDTDGAVHPDATEVCNGWDDDCDLLVDDDDPSLTDPTAEWAGYVDGDGDGWGAWRDGVCHAESLTDVPGDCDDRSARISPDAEEICDNHIDDDCSGDDAGCLYEGLYRLEDGLGLGGRELSVLRGSAGDGLGSAIAATLDGDGDGEPMIVVGAERTGVNDGAVLVYRGGIAAGIDLRDRDRAVVQIDAVTRDAHLGAAVAVGDLTGDGWPDVVMGAPDELAPEGARTGAVYVFDGAALADGLYTTDDAPIVLYGVDGGDDFGTALAVGDLDCDGLPDLAIGAPGTGEGSPGEVHVVYGPLDPGAHVADLVIEGQRGDRIGNALAAVGDGTGVAPECDDLAIGAQRKGPPHNQGAVYRFLHSDLAAMVGALASADDAHFTLLATDVAYLGGAVSPAGDVDGDGFADMLVGAPRTDTVDGAGQNHGQVWWVSGMNDGVVDAVEGDTVTALVGDEAGAELGTAVAAVGDLDGDGRTELAASAPGARVDAVNDGRVHLLYGADGPPTGPAPHTHATFTAHTQDALGTALAALPDLDGDGYPELAITAEDAKDELDGGSRHGAVYILFGSGR